MYMYIKSSHYTLQCRQFCQLNLNKVGGKKAKMFVFNAILSLSIRQEKGKHRRLQSNEEKDLGLRGGGEVVSCKKAGHEKRDHSK